MRERIGGEFILQLPSGGELVLQNQFTIIGIQQVLRAAFWQEELDWQIGLCAHNPASSIPLAAINEPSGANGYLRQSMFGNLSNWPEMGVINGESFVQSRDFTFVATGAYDLAVNRLFITDGTQVIAVSSALEGGLQYVDSDLTTRYRLYFR